jgi:hypothetical protein
MYITVNEVQACGWVNTPMSAASQYSTYTIQAGFNDSAGTPAKHPRT